MSDQMVGSFATRQPEQPYYQRGVSTPFRMMALKLEGEAGRAGRQGQPAHSIPQMVIMLPIHSAIKPFLKNVKYLPYPLHQTLLLSRSTSCLVASPRILNWLLWHYRLWNIKSRDTKLERFLHKKNQRKLLNFENWCNGELSKIGNHFSIKVI